uniref:Retrotransposon gag protein n=1 Tax=Nicotiana tabacum TaxID=4097 RepID=A0A1S4D3P7_TOBAC|nr:PREDICTED: uncharacterized protein LOC107825635 [Nicotiana tabacum]
MAREIRKLTLAKVQSQPSLVCDFCGMGHPTHECQASTTDEMGTTIREQGTAIRNLERQVGQLANLLSERVLGTLPADSERNPKETINAVSLRSGHVLEDPIAKQKNELIERQVEIVEEQKDSTFKKVLVNLTFTEVLSQMPAYAKFLKEILSNKQKVKETPVVNLTEHCNAILQNTLPQKKLEGEIGEIRSIHVSLYLADQTTIIQENIVENMLVWVDKFVFPVDFIVVNMEENREIPMILGRPFLATGRAILDIQERQLMLRVG